MDDAEDALTLAGRVRSGVTTAPDLRLARVLEAAQPWRIKEPVAGLTA